MLANAAAMNYGFAFRIANYAGAAPDRRRCLRRLARAAGRGLAAQLDLRGGGRRRARRRAPAQLVPRLPGGTDAAGDDLRRDRPGGAGPRHPPDVVLPVRRGRIGRRAVLRLPRRGHRGQRLRPPGDLPARTRSSAARCGSATTTPPRPAPRTSMTRAWTKFSRCWSGAGWSGRWPGCARSRYCTEEDRDCALDQLRDSGGGCWRPREAVAVDVPSGPLAVRRTAAELRALPAGTPVVLLDHRPGGRLRARRIAAAGAIVVDRQYVALPSLRTGHRGGRGQHRLAPLGLPVTGDPAARRHLGARAGRRRRQVPAPPSRGSPGGSPPDGSWSGGRHDLPGHPGPGTRARPGSRRAAAARRGPARAAEHAGQPDRPAGRVHVTRTPA